ncbi:D-tagatose-bisphosphate aldolase, class II, non-catalytic subunit [Asticcacaulis sp. EMRT-3]|uniref:D-tagatose-bisphosphate aldolase, class II, non-catalytic subunit n=1 Tax=Asticcacaulis sp. EMRT-3 TaxID=3040349 RepID=UPI0024AF4427|nr:D-tagatose-bisphosphate aldolase, class II, non-catalytic subunit [Asticcacaulis sp. EMRT-3]MDI7775750.1 D-tagatose-bisphosphate aldolase, class II, non-catalytic subunit [Asticcacaulis sp. EMRT-3]
MRAMLDLVARHKAGVPCGIVSVCSAHPLVVEASLRHALTHDAPIALIEATCNQVNQDGGYTGMQPADFRDFVFVIADRIGLPRARILLGGDHLGPNPWTHLPSAEAMDKAEVMVAAYVRAGFRKIHADCSMSCADDPVPLAEKTIAERAARLIAVSEAVWREAGGEAPVYVIGTEVPVPGGASEDLPELEVTSPEAALTTIRTHERIFRERGLTAAWPRVIAEVVQPGVEFDHHKVIDYDRAKAKALSRAIETLPTILYEAHSTDYQTPQHLRELVEDHFAILKVGPGVTFALREALWALDAIEREWIAADRSNFRDVVLERMRALPHNWSKYYHGEGHALAFDLQYSLSDRIRYYWPDAEIMAAQQQMFDNLTENPPPLALISQYMPDAYAAIRGQGLVCTPAHLVMAHISVVLDGYSAATQGQVEMLDA